MKRHLDFKTIITPPEIVNQTQSGSCSNRGAYLLRVLSGKIDYPERYDKMIGRQEGESVEMAIRRFLRENPEYEKFGSLQLQCLEETGFIDWYEWNNQHWGTKWNACEGDIEHVLTHEGASLMEFTFDTAWSVPEPVWAQLAEMFPEIVFRIVFFDEGWIFAGGGYFNSREEPDGFEYSDPSAKDPRWRNFYYTVYQKPYELIQDEGQSASGGQ